MLNKIFILTGGLKKSNLLLVEHLIFVMADAMTPIDWTNLEFIFLAVLTVQCSGVVSEIIIWN